MELRGPMGRSTHRGSSGDYAGDTGTMRVHAGEVIGGDLTGFGPEKREVIASHDETQEPLIAPRQEVLDELFSDSFRSPADSPHARSTVFRDLHFRRCAHFEEWLKSYVTSSRCSDQRCRGHHPGRSVRTAHWRSGLA